VVHTHHADHGLASGRGDHVIAHQRRDGPCFHWFPVFLWEERVMTKFRALLVGVLLLGFAGVASAQVDCAEIEQVKIKPKPKRNRMKVVVKSDLPGGTMLTIEQDLGDGTVQSKMMEVNADGKGRVMMRNVVFGGNAVRVVECPEFSNCYAACENGEEGEFSTCFESCDEGQIASCGCDDTGEAMCECIDG